MKDSTMRGQTAALVFLGALLLTGPAWGFPTTDYPAWVQRNLKFLQSAQNMAQTASNYAQNVMQTYMMAHNMVTAPLQSLSMMNGPSSQVYQAYTNLSYQSNQLAGDISGQNTAMYGAYNSFSLSGLSPSAFIKAEETDAYGSSAASQNEVQAVQQADQKTTSQIQAVQQTEQQIPADSSLHAQMELFNEQLVALRKQNIELNAEIKALVASDAMKNNQLANGQAATQAASNAGNSSFAGWRRALNKSFGVNAPPGTVGGGGG